MVLLIIHIVHFFEVLWPRMRTVNNKIIPTSSSPSWTCGTSRWTSLITCVMPVSLQDDQFIFSLFSLKTIVYLLLMCGWNVLLLYLIFDVILNASIDMFFVGTFVQQFSTFMAFGFSYMGIIMVLIFCHGLSNIKFKCTISSLWPPTLITTTGNFIVGKSYKLFFKMT